MENQSEAMNLRKAIQALEAQRDLLGDTVVEAALAPMREKLAALEASVPSGQRKLVSVLFADLAGFTAMAARIDAEDVREIMDGYFQRWAACIKRQEGAVEKYIGDAVLAVFGLPVSHEDDPERSIRAALEMQKELLLFNDHLQSKGREPLAMRVGINTGEVVVSLQGERLGEEFVIVGDIVNLASRLQAAAPDDGILITQDTFRHVRGLFETRPYGPLQLKGLDLPVQAYLVEAVRPRAFRLGNRGIEGMETPMIGREADLERLEQAFHQAAEEKNMRVCTLIGEAGVGKSRLLYEFENWLELLPQKIYYFRARAHSSNQHLPYALIRDVFSFRCQIQDTDPPHVVRKRLERNAQEILGQGEDGKMKIHFIARLIGFEISESQYLGEVEGDAKSLHDRALVYLREYFRAAAILPVVILLEDIHWADSSSLDLVEQVFHLLPGQPLLIVFAARPALLDFRPDWGETFSLPQRIDLAPLNRDASRVLVEEILKKVDDIPPTLLDLIVNTAEGNPFFVEELLKMLMEDGVIQQMEDHWSVEESRLGKLRVPPTLTGVLQARFDGLDLQERSTLQRGSVVGRVFWDQALEAMQLSSDPQPVDPATIQSCLAQLRQHGMIFQREMSSFEHTAEYLFKHALLRDVTYSSLLKRERRFYHGLVARWLEEMTGRMQRSSEFAMLIAEHYENAGDGSNASEWYLNAGRASAQRFANIEAVHAIAKALELSTNPDLKWKFEALLEREKVYELLGKRVEQLRDLDEMQATGEAADDAILIATAALRRAIYAFQTGIYPSALEHAQRAQELAESIQFPEIVAQSYLLQSSTFNRLGEPEHAESFAQRALTLAGQQGLTGIEANSYRHLGLAAYYQGNSMLARDHFTQALQLYQRAHDRTGESIALNNLGNAAFEMGDYVEAGKYYAQALEKCRAMGDRIGEGRGLNNLGIIAIIQNEYDLAEQYYLEALRIAREVGQRSYEMSALDNLGNLALSRYEFSRAEKYQIEALNGARSINDRSSENRILINQSILYSMVGAVEKVQKNLTEAEMLSKLRNDIHEYLLLLLVRSRHEVVTGDLQAAHQTASEALSIALKGENLSDIMYANFRTGMALCHLGRFVEAAEYFQNSLEMHLQAGERDIKISNEMGMALAFLGQGEIETACAWVNDILNQLAETGYQGFEEPGAILLTCYRVLRAANDPRAEDILGRGYHFLQGTASKIETEAMRQSYLERVPENRAIIEAWDRMDMRPTS